jgi:CubicO group peptidase (beta-lactamase class C family)
VTSAPGLAAPSDALPRLLDALERGVDAGLHTAAQVFVSLAGTTLADFGYGPARPERAMAPDSIVIWLSSSKPVTVVALAQLWEDGLLDLDDPVARHVPEFAHAGKERVTLRHLLTHTAGLRHVSFDWTGEPWDEIVARVAASPMEPGWVPGQKAGYHVGSTWFVLGEVIRRLTGTRLSERVRQGIFEPLGMDDSWIGMPPERFDAYGERIALFYDTSPKGGGAPHRWSQRDRVARCAPSGNGWGPARELGWFYEMLLFRGERAGVRLLSPQAVEALTAPHRVGLFDETFRHVMDWGLGFIVNTHAAGRETQPYGFGRHASPRTFGHGGYQSSVALCDPEHGLVAAIVTNGTPGASRHARRVRELLTALYEDLGLERTPAGDRA